MKRLTSPSAQTPAGSRGSVELMRDHGPAVRPGRSTSDQAARRECGQPCTSIVMCDSCGHPDSFDL